MVSYALDKTGVDRARGAIGIDRVGIGKSRGLGYSNVSQFANVPRVE